MSLKNLPNAIIPVLLCATAAFSTSTLAQAVTAITSGDVCAPRDVGSANKSIQNLRGSIVNTSATEMVGIVCPLLAYDVGENSAGESSGRVQALVSNAATFDQIAVCSLQQFAAGNQFENEQSGTTIPAESSAIVSFEFTRVEGARLGLSCGLHPSFSLGLIVIENEE